MTSLTLITTFVLATFLKQHQPPPPPPVEVGIVLQVIQPVSHIQAPQAKELPEVVVDTSEPVEAPQQASGVVSGCGDNEYAQFIYMHESGCRLDANNGSCVGIGQACPSSKLYAVCPDLNYACQNAFFTDYANRTYGGWYQAYQAWQSKRWW